jgi:uncharacterized repeat protein (TIGR03803 family)
MAFLALTLGLATETLAQMSVLHSFGSVANDGVGDANDPPDLHLGSTLVLSGSTLYGVTTYGGVYHKGIIFRVNTDGSGYQILHDFRSVSDDGAVAFGSLALSGSRLYGTTSSGGVYNNGIIFRVNTDGSGYNVLYNFGGTTDDGGSPCGSLALSGSTLYGATTFGGTHGNGTIFLISTDGSGYKILYNFGSIAYDGTFPWATLTLSGSVLYGTTSTGGSYALTVGGGGTIFSINTDGSGYQTLYNFGSAVDVIDGGSPWGALTLSGSMLYGTTGQGGSGGVAGTAGHGTIFRISTDGSGYEILHNFGTATGYSDGTTALWAP